jgi:hypothetical protein
MKALPQINNSSYNELLFGSSVFSFFLFFEYYWIGYVITIKVANTAEIDGISTVVYLINCNCESVGLELWYA